MTHKEIKKDIHNKLTEALTELQTLLGEKKFSNRIKKAAKLLAEGIGKEPKAEAAGAGTKIEKKSIIPAAKKAAAVKAPARKAAKAPVKKTAKPVAKKAVKTPVAKKKVASKTK